MSERKVQNKYYHPELFESKIPKKKKPKNDQTKIRNMVAMTIQCAMCGEYIFSGKKLNSRKEIIYGDEYLGMKNFRFYIRCTRCAGELVLKTDYENDRYVCELNCKSIHDNIIRKENEPEEGNEHTLKCLEEKATSTKEFHYSIDLLEELKEGNHRRERFLQKEHLRTRKKIHTTTLKCVNQSDEDEKELDEFIQFQAQIKSNERNVEEDGSPTPAQKGPNSFLEGLTTLQPKKKKRKQSKIVVGLSSTLSLDYE